MSLNIIGIAFTADATAALVSDGVLVAAIGEERLNREKLWKGVPRKAIDKVLEIGGLKLSEIDFFAVHGAPTSPDKTAFEAAFQRIREADISEALREHQLQQIQQRLDHETFVCEERTPAIIRELESLGRPVITFPHHEAHAASAYYASGWDDCITVTADGWGEDASGTIWSCSNGKMEHISTTPTIDSLGYFYGAITKSLGFIPHRHEGKVLGLAAYCSDPKSYGEIGNMVSADVEGAKFVGHAENGLFAPTYDSPPLVDFIQNYSREDVSAAAQKRLEEVVCELISSLSNTPKRFALAGGIFANVKLNQRITELDNVSDVYVFPCMGDGGLAVGTAWLAYVEKTGKNPVPPKSMLLGMTIEDDEVVAALEKSGLPYERPENLAHSVADLLADGSVVVRCNGAMEYGPRSLGNRSILYKANDPSANEWLNDRLKRSEFMPFAPATLIEDAPELYHNLDKARVPANYMTMTFDCTEKMCQDAPAAVHIDKTARPQLVSKELYPEFHEILEHYKSLTGFSSVVNTSFNMHEEPIVGDASDAIRAFVASGLPYMALGDYLVRQPDGV
ncbi:carbamoyltransferase C-terminal domain-containing protein [Magnetovibrio sp. PR-2]|uniref:carbamoyltransferase C-terminal domain-containing protein n=1 Tax=Magnetovibrio sp. PR-2 TaxID=3120356 RepID=UPI002FCE45E0